MSTTHRSTHTTPSHKTVIFKLAYVNSLFLGAWKRSGCLGTRPVNWYNAQSILSHTITQPSSTLALKYCIATISVKNLIIIHFLVIKDIPEMRTSPLYHIWHQLGKEVKTPPLLTGDTLRVVGIEGFL